MIESMMVGFGLFLCVIAGAIVARITLGRMDLFDANDDASEIKPKVKRNNKLPNAIEPKEDWPRE